eukprot:Seg1796.4 transcript_id=Seg1796.4/GoldUCD/mRNA.D3Y31 product="Bloom syndrome protein" protein_id=Seg1796.4/GoldUCD/D3Y31
MEAWKTITTFFDRIEVAVRKSGYERKGLFLKPAQVEALFSVFCRSDTMVVLPTGYGKSVIFHLLPWLLSSESSSGIVIVVCPLNALISDQMKKLRNLGIPVYFLHQSSDCEDVSFEEAASAPSCAVFNDGQHSLSDARIVFVHAETVVSPSDQTMNTFLADNFQKNVVACVVDEAHCVVEWGSRNDSFRPDYGKLSALRSYFPDVPVIGLTATAPYSHLKMIVKLLQLQSPNYVSRSPNRPNIFYMKRKRLPSIHGSKSYDDILLPIATSLKSSPINFPLTIIYLPLKWCGYAYRVFENILADDQYLPKDEKIPDNRLFAQFHSPQESAMKSMILQQLVQSRPVCRVIFATSALGMGVDAPRIERIIHIGPPRSLEAYFQETGRAGRAGHQAEAVLYYNNTDISKSVREMSDSVRSYCRSDDLCLRQQLLSHFQYQAPACEKHSCCDVCQKKCPCDTCDAKTSEPMSVEEDAAPSVRSFLSSESKIALLKDLGELRVQISSGFIRFGGGIDAATGLTVPLIEKVVEMCLQVTDVDFLMENFDFWFREHAEIFFKTICKHTLLE